MEDHERLNMVVEHVERLKGGAYKRLDFERIRRIAFEMLNGHRFTSIHYKPGLHVVRARAFNSLEEIFENVASPREILWPHPSAVSSYSRCGWPGYSVLYTSDNFDTVLSEARLLQGQYVCLGHIHSIDGFFVVAIGEIDRYRRTGQTLDPSSISHAKKIYQSGDTATMSVDAFLSDLLTKPCNHPADYKLSSSFCAEIFDPPAIGNISKSKSKTLPSIEDIDSQDLVGAICYSSVPHGGGLNFAFKPATYEKKLQLKNCAVWKLTEDYGYGIYRKELIAESEVVEDDEIIWNLK